MPMTDSAINPVVKPKTGAIHRFAWVAKWQTQQTLNLLQLWNSRWNRRGEAHRRPKILYLADRNTHAYWYR